MAIKYSKPNRFKVVSVTLEEETIKEIEEFTKKFKKLRKTEIMRFAIEYVIYGKLKEFEKEMRQLDSPLKKEKCK